MNAIIGVGGVLLQEDNILVVKEDATDPTTRKEKGQISIPMGHIIPGESPEKAIVREFLEETGYEVRPVGSLGIFCVPGTNVSGHVFLVELIPGQISSASNGDSLLHPQWVNVESLLLLVERKVRPPTREIVQAALRASSTNRPP